MKFSSHEISDALRESLIDRGIVDKATGKPTQDYFELDIKEGPILGLAQKAYDLEGTFHVGCVADIRPPNFHYNVSVGDSQTKKGMTYLRYWRELRLTTFTDNNAFRKHSPVINCSVRDLETLSKAFNEVENHKETFGIYWNGWSGEYGPAILRPGKRAKYSFAGEAIELDFENGFCTGFDGIDNVFGNPKEGFNVPFYKLSKGTRLETVAQLAKDKVWAGRILRSFDIDNTKVKLKDLMTGVLQVAGKILPAKMSTEELEQEIIKACSGFKMAPQGYDFTKESEFRSKHGGDDVD
jgi:hypothetical protein